MKTRKTILKEGGVEFDTNNKAAIGSVLQLWERPDNVAIYGGGQYQNGLINYANTPLEMVQFNTEAIVPYFVSTEGMK